MITVSVSYRGSNILHLSITGHAMSAKRGQDLVCASVSSIATGALNALDLMVSKACDLTLVKGEDALIEIKVLENGNHDVQIILQTVLAQLETIENQYSKYIHIAKQEV